MPRFLKWLLSLLLTALLLWAAVRQVDLGETLRYLNRARPLHLLAALVISFAANCWLASEKWRFIIRRLGLDLSLREAFMLKMSSGLIKSVLPFRSGEASRVVYLKRAHGFSLTASSVSLIVELGSNLLVFAVLIPAFGLLLKANPGGCLLPLILLVAAGGLAVLLAARTPLRGAIIRGTERIPWVRARSAARAALSAPGRFSRKDWRLVLGYSLLIQSGKFATFYLISRSLGFTLSLPSYLVVLPLSILVSTVPLTFLGMGIREYSLVEIIPLFDPAIPSALLLGSALLFSAVEYIFPVLLGVFWLKPFFDGLAGSRPRFSCANNRHRGRQECRSHSEESDQQPKKK
jgi:uncharacterized membrane protein YbhN (UPF0104 family)